MGLALAVNLWMINLLCCCYVSIRRKLKVKACFSKWNLCFICWWIAPFTSNKFPCTCTGTDGPGNCSVTVRETRQTVEEKSGSDEKTARRRLEKGMNLQLFMPLHLRIGCILLYLCLFFQTIFPMYNVHIMVTFALTTFDSEWTLWNHGVSLTCSVLWLL